jgi:hypothetical protein
VGKVENYKFLVITIFDFKNKKLKYFLKYISKLNEQTVKAIKVYKIENDCF